MSNQKPFVDGAENRQSPTIGDSDKLLCGNGVDASAAGAFSIGATNATTITIGRSGQTVNIAGNFSVTGSSTSSTTVDMVDRVIHLGTTTGNAAVPTLPIGISADRGASGGVDRDMSSLVWDEPNSRWFFGFITQGDDATLGAAQAVHAGSFIAPTFGRADAGAMALGGSATSIVVGAPMTFAAAQTGTIQKRTVTIGVSGSGAEVELTTVGLSQVINLGAVLPANAMVLGADIALTPFAGGGAAAVLADIGTTGDDDAIVANADLFAAAVDGKASAVPDGIAAHKLFSVAGAQLLVTVTGDVNVSTLTAGSATVTLAFVALP